MKVTLFLLILPWFILGVIFYLLWCYNKDEKLKLHYWITQYITIIIASSALILTTIEFYFSQSIRNDEIVPQLQVKPVGIIDRINITQIEIEILNYSEYVAKNILVDIKFADHPWKRELTKAEYKDTDRKIVFDYDDEKLKTMLEKYYNRPIWDELMPGKAIKLLLADEKKEFIKNSKTYISYPDGRMIPISPTETTNFRLSQGWYEDLIGANTGEPIRVLLRAGWENEIGKLFDRISEYQLFCTKIGTGVSYTFIPTGIVIEDK